MTHPAPQADAESRNEPGPADGRRRNWSTWSAVAAVTVVLAVTAGRYGYHRDELYFRLLPLRWGYVDQPPLLPALVHLSQAVLGDHLWAIRVPAIACGAVSVLVIAAIVRTVGGGTLAVAVAVWGYAFGTMTLALSHVMLTASIDLVLWPAIVLLVIKIARGADPRMWLWPGVLVGLGTYDKWLIVMIVFGVLAGLLIMGPRSALRTRWLAAAAGLAVLVALPNVLWQITHGLPQLDMAGALSSRNGNDVRTTLVPLLLVMISPLLCWVWILGIVDVFRRPDWRTIRFLPIALLVVVGLTLAGGSQIYYPYPALAVMYAVGCAALGDRIRRTGTRRVMAILVALSVLTSVVINLPLLPVRVLSATPIPVINQSVRDQIGWERYVQQIDAVTRQALADDPGTVVLATNYGEAGAIDRFSEQQVGVYSGHNALAELGPPPPDTLTVVVVGGQYETAVALFNSCQIVSRLDNGVGIDNEEQGVPVGICTQPKAAWTALWPKFRHLS